MFGLRRKRIDEEMESHLAHETAENIARGMDPVAARDAALKTFGNVESAKESVRERDPLYWLDSLMQDVRFAFRLIARNPWTSATIIATLTVGIALNVSVFSVLNGLLLRPWVQTEPETLVAVIPRFSGEYRLRYSDGGMSQPDYARYRDGARSLQSLAAYRMLSVTLSGEESGSIRGGLISCNLFDVIRPGAPILGRYLAPEECTQPRQSAAVVLSENAWRTRFNADRGIVGRVVFLNRIPFTVVGVAPNFTVTGPMNECDLWLPYTVLQNLRPMDEYFADVRANWLNVVGRRKPEYSIDQVREELNILARNADEEVPGRLTSLTVTDGSLLQEPELRAKAPLIFAVTLGTATLLLLLACVNVTTLLLSRAAARQKEIDVRVALGAGRFRILRQLLTESLMLSGIAAVFSALLAQRAPQALWRSLMPQAAPIELAPDWRVLAYCMAIALAAGVIAGLSPALESLRQKGPRKSRLRGTLVAVQVALSVLLLVQAGLFARAQRRFFSYDPGFETKQVLIVTLESVRAGFEPPSAFYQELDSRVNSAPGVAGSAYSSLAPWHGRNSTVIREIDGRANPEPLDHGSAPARRMVTPGYFRTLGIPLTRGRGFTGDDQRPDRPVTPVVISEAMARRYWPGRDPVGRHFSTGTIHEVVGVCRDLQSVGHMQDDGPFYYVPLDPQRSKPAYLLVRVSSDTQMAAGTVREIVRQMDPQMASTLVTLESLVEQQGERLKPVMIHGAIAGLLALLLAITGVYAIVSCSVSQRMSEIGIRVALGADRRDVVSMVLRSGGAPVAGGLAAGLGLSLLAASAMKSLLFGLNPHDPFVLIAVPVLLLAAALFAIWIPARRAAGVDPLLSLRCE